jgi:hypothetical protein
MADVGHESVCGANLGRNDAALVHANTLGRMDIRHCDSLESAPVSADQPGGASSQSRTGNRIQFPSGARRPSAEDRFARNLCIFERHAMVGDA